MTPTPHDSRRTIDGVGDVVLAGYPTPYPHLRTESARPGAGTLFAAARRVGDAIRIYPPSVTGRWTDDAHDLTVAATVGPETNTASTASTASTATGVAAVFVAVPPADVVVAPFAGRDTGTAHETLLYAAQGEVHVVEFSAAGHVHNVRQLGTGRGFAWGAQRQHRIINIINTGSVPALLVHASSLGA